jgi:hypothetical protein
MAGLTGCDDSADAEEKCLFNWAARCEAADCDVAEGVVVGWERGKRGLVCVCVCLAGERGEEKVVERGRAAVGAPE